jgi:hypothetical protein
MRGGALAPLIWSVLLLALAVTNVIWTSGDAIQAGTFGFAIVSIWLLGLVLIRLAPEARRKGPPEPLLRPEVVPSASLAAMVAGIGFGAFVFGFAFGRFWIFLGAGVFLASLGRLFVELRAQRRAHRRSLRESPHADREAAS